MTSGAALTTIFCVCVVRGGRPCCHSERSRGISHFHPAAPPDCLTVRDFSTTFRIRETPLEMTSGAALTILFFPPLVCSRGRTFLSFRAKSRNLSHFFRGASPMSNSKRFLDSVSRLRNSARNDKRGSAYNYFLRLRCSRRRTFLSFRAKSRNLSHSFRGASPLSNSKRFLDYVSRLRNSARNDKRGSAYNFIFFRVWFVREEANLPVVPSEVEESLTLSRRHVSFSSPASLV
jgi:hypothetical protein